MRLDGDFVVDDIGTILRTGPGSVAISGMLDNSGTTLALDVSTGDYRLDTGWISGGQITQSDGAFLRFGSLLTGNRLVGVSIDRLDLTEASSFVALRDGTQFETADLRDGSRLGIEETRTLDGVTVNVLGGFATTTFGVSGPNVLTLGASSVVNLTGNNSRVVSDIGTPNSQTGTIVNGGEIVADGQGASRRMFVQPDVITNDGLMASRGGADLRVGCGACTVTNVDGATLRGGRWEVTGDGQILFIGGPVKGLL